MKVKPSSRNVASSSCVVHMLCSLFFFVCRANFTTIPWHFGLYRMETVLFICHMFVAC